MCKHKTTHALLLIAKKQMLYLGERSTAVWSVAFGSVSHWCACDTFWAPPGDNKQGDARSGVVQSLFHGGLLPCHFFRHDLVFFVVAVIWCLLSFLLLASIFAMLYKCCVKLCPYRFRGASQATQVDSRTIFQLPFFLMVLSTLLSALGCLLSLLIDCAHNSAHNYCSWLHVSAPFLYDAST